MNDMEAPSWPEHLAGDQWRAVDGDYSHRLNHELNEQSTVFDVGGFKGEFTNGIHAKYKSNVYIFEPIKEYYDFLKLRFADNPKIKAFNYGFAAIDKTASISVANNSSSLFVARPDAPAETIILKSFKNFLSLFPRVDLAEINIEGSEYELLESLDSSDLKKIKNIQVQFHLCVPECRFRRERIREKLSLTHELTYDYAFVWENWKLKPELC